MSSYKTDSEEVKDWELPNLETPQFIEQATENAFNIKPKWQYEPPDEQETEVLPPTAEEIEAIRKAAFDEGFAEGKQQGLEAGHAEGLEKGTAEGMEQGQEQGKELGFEQGKLDAENLVITLEALIQQLHEPLEQVNSQVKQQVCLLAASLAKAVIHTEVTTNTAVIDKALDKGLEALPLNETDIHIHVSSDDLHHVNSVIPEEKRQNMGWNIVEKPSLAQGGCEIVSKNNAVDVSIERRIRDVIDQFLLSHGLHHEQS